MYASTCVLAGLANPSHLALSGRRPVGLYRTLAVLSGIFAEEVWNYVYVKSRSVVPELSVVDLHSARQNSRWR